MTYFQRESWSIMNNVVSLILSEFIVMTCTLQTKSLVWEKVKSVQCGCNQQVKIMGILINASKVFSNVSVSKHFQNSSACTWQEYIFAVLLFQQYLVQAISYGLGFWAKNFVFEWPITLSNRG